VISVCIFSKDRACQLDLLLRSIKTYFTQWSKQKIAIIYKATSEQYTNGYELVKKKHPEFIFIKENNFKEDVKGFFAVSFKSVMFLVDDDIFINEFSVESNEFKQFLSSPEILALSPRMHPNITYCYPTKTKATPPALNNNVWNWRTAQPNTDWSYPMSVDGNIFRADEILPLVFNLGYTNPNSFEGALASYAVVRSTKSLVKCFNIPTLINNPVNIVQTLSYNHSGLSYSQPIAMLNEMFLCGKEINLSETISQLKELNAPHIEFPYVFR
jgi:hypothetical protein